MEFQPGSADASDIIAELTEDVGRLTKEKAFSNAQLKQAHKYIEHVDAEKAQLALELSKLREDVGVLKSAVGGRAPKSKAGADAAVIKGEVVEP